MATINIAGLTPVEDPSYRYKMPRVIGKVEGRGNGIKTVLVNVTDLGLALNREAPEITKFFGCELGSQTTYAADTDRAIVNGAHIDGDLQRHLSRYIEFFVLCKNCRLPETHYKIKDGLISQKCLACGSKEAVDMAHKLTSFILAQHKKAKETKKEAEKKASKDEKKEKKKEKKEKNDNNAENGCEDEVKKEKKEKKEKKDKEKKRASEGGSSPSSDAIVKDTTVFGFTNKDGEGLTEENEEEDEPDSKVADDAMERYKLWLSLNASASTTEIVDELRAIQTMASLRPSDRPIIFLGAVFKGSDMKFLEIEEHHAILNALAPTAIQQRHLIAAFEWLCGTKFPNLIKFFPVALKKLLDEELIEEETFLTWHTDYTRNEFSAEQSMMNLETLEQLKSTAAPFITWLMEAEEEDDDSGEEEEVDDNDD